MNYLNLAGIVLGSASVGAILGVFGMAALVNYDEEQEADRRYRLGLRRVGRTALSDLEEDR